MSSRLLSDVLFLISSIIFSRSGKKYPYLVLRPRRKAMRLLTLGMILSYKPFYDDFYDGICFLALSYAGLVHASVSLCVQ